MSMDVSRLHYPADYERLQAAKTAAQQMQQSQQAQARSTQRQSGRQQGNIDAMAEELEHVSAIFNRKLKFTVDRELNEVVVKVIDTTTDKVIKELPPEALQRLHVRIREALGLLFDETI
jgi:flagellar protein FlaG